MLENVGEVDLEFFMAVEDDGSVSTYETVATFHVEETDEDFIIFVEEGAQEGEELEVMAALYNPAEVVEGNVDMPLVTLYALENEEQAELVEAVLHDMMEEE
ncbi:hypothetical protein [Adlercreutzia caecimuris]|uniref:hypothetical protein n=1 Tax=Adlercreutzia caecimuris TaxID=671266 RepID=UPI00272A0DCA|nr:hypothetical protein [Adlercreutzia caecimuris]